MANNGIVRRIDDLGRIVIPKEIRRNMGLNDGDALEITYNKGTVSIRKYKKSFEECAVEWYSLKTNSLGYFRKTDFWHRGDYTFCVVHIENTTRAGFAKCSKEDYPDERIGKVAAYANAMGKNLNEMIGYEG